MKKSHLLALALGLGLAVSSCTGLGMGISSSVGTSYPTGYYPYDYGQPYHAVPVWAWGNPYYDYPTHVVLIPRHHHYYQPAAPYYPLPNNPGVGPVVGGSSSANPIIPSHRLPVNQGVGPVVIPIQPREATSENSSVVPPEPLPLNRGVGLQVPSGR